MSNNNQIAAGSLFGLFLTQFLCLLSQPVGSLWYSKPSSALGRTIFFFWRLNPFACLAETVLILFALADVFISATVGVRAESRQDFTSRLHRGLTAILLLRQHGARWRPPSSSISTESVEAQPGHRDLHGDVESGSLRDTQAASRVLHHGSLQASPISVFIPSSDIIIDIFALCANLLVAVKVGAATLPWYISVWLWVYLSGWLTVAVLLLMLHITSHELNRKKETGLGVRPMPSGAPKTTEEAHIFTLACVREARLTRFGLPLAAITTLPMLGYGSYLLVSAALEAEKGDLASRLGPGYNAEVQVPLYLAFFCALVGGIVKRFIWPRDIRTELLAAWRRASRPDSPIAYVGWTLSALGVVFASGNIFFFGIKLEAEVSGQGFVVGPQVGPLWREWFAFPVTFLLAGYWFYMPVVDRHFLGEWILVVTHGWSLAHFVQMLVWVFVRYDPQGTYTPSWVDWLG